MCSFDFLDQLTPEERFVYDRMNRRRATCRKASKAYRERHRDAINARRRARNARCREDEAAVLQKLADLNCTPTEGGVCE